MDFKFTGDRTIKKVARHDHVCVNELFCFRPPLSSRHHNLVLFLVSWPQMAGALSGHIINAYEASLSNQSICTDGLISFNPSMHGAFNPNMHSTQQQQQQQQQQQSFSFSNLSQASTSMGESAYDRVSRLQAKLNQKLGPEFVSQRAGPGGGKLTYAEGWKVINVANEVFGFEGWSSNIVSLTTDYMDYNEETRRYNVGVSAVMRVTLKEGVFHEDVGYGMIENAKGKGMALDKVRNAPVFPSSPDQSFVAVQERGGDRRAEAHPSYIRERHGQLLIR
jgi:DNA recombination protein Rad52